YLIVWLGHPHTNAAVWLPALVLAGEQLLHAEDGARRLRAVALLAALVGVQLTGGHIETAVDVLFCLGLYYGLRWCQVVPRRGVLVVLPALAVALGAAPAGDVVRARHAGGLRGRRGAGRGPGRPPLVPRPRGGGRGGGRARRGGGQPPPAAPRAAPRGVGAAHGGSQVRGPARADPV